MTARADQTKQPLKDRTVVTVGSDALAQPHLRELERFGARALNCPTVEIVDLESHERLDEALEHLYGYDWLLFTSVHAADYFLRRLKSKGLASEIIDDLLVCAIGDATQKSLRDARVHVDVAPLTPRTSEVLAALEQFVVGASELSGLNFVSPRAAVGGDALTRALSDAGARVDVVPSYRVRLPDDAEPGRTAALLAGQADCILLTTPDAVSNLARLFDSHDLSEVLGEVLVVATDDESAKAGAQYGIQIGVLPAQAKATAQAIAEHLSSK